MFNTTNVTTQPSTTVDAHLRVDAPTADPVGTLLAALGTNPSLLTQLGAVSPDSARALAQMLVDELSTRVHDRNANHVAALHELVDSYARLEPVDRNQITGERKQRLALMVGRLRPGSAIRDAMEYALNHADGPVLALCRSLGTLATQELARMDAAKAQP